MQNAPAFAAPTLTLPHGGGNISAACLVSVHYADTLHRDVSNLFDVYIHLSARCVCKPQIALSQEMRRQSLPKLSPNCSLPRGGGAGFSHEKADAFFVGVRGGVGWQTSLSKVALPSPLFYIHLSARCVCKPQIAPSQETQRQPLPQLSPGRTQTLFTL